MVTSPSARERRERRLGLAAIALAFVVGLATAHGCVDDRGRVAAQVFFCNPSSRTADADCGNGYVCYSAVQSIGGSICAPRCNPDNPAGCNGACTATGACLTRCHVPDPGQPEPCPQPLICRRITISQLESMNGTDGVCLPINSSCSQATDCTSPIFNECTSNVTGATQGGGLLRSGEICVQGKCSQRGIACEPGSACIKEILPSAIPVPDVCSPICGSARDRTDGGLFNECLPGMTCLADAFPQADAPACAPGFAGWLCIDQYGCTAGTCDGWGDVMPLMNDFKTCSPRCDTDKNCVAFDRGGNPDVITHNTCHHGSCRNWQSVFFPLVCLRAGDVCKLDSDRSQCQPQPTVPPPPGDLGPPPTCVRYNPVTTLGLGAFGGQAMTCTRPCQTKAECADLAQTLHMPLVCRDVGGGKRCLPVLPYMTSCIDDTDCMGDLNCLDTPTDGRVCTHTCTSSADCGNDAALGTTFTCDKGLCVPKVESGCQATIADQCISGQMNAAGTCVSPFDWACNANNQCASGHCVLIAGTSPPFGRCE
jgi:hypothetical protein